MQQQFWPFRYPQTLARYYFPSKILPVLRVIQIFQIYAGTVKRHNICKRHVAIGTGFKQAERTIFLHIISMGLKLPQLNFQVHF